MPHTRLIVACCVMWSGRVGAIAAAPTLTLTTRGQYTQVLKSIMIRHETTSTVLDLVRVPAKVSHLFAGHSRHCGRPKWLIKR